MLRLCPEAGAGVPDGTMWIVTRGATQHRPAPWGQRGAPSAAELLLWGSESHKSVLVKGSVSVQPYEDSKVPRFVTSRAQEWGSAMSWEKAVLEPRSRASRAAST